jgi:hypothetical protein
MRDEVAIGRICFVSFPLSDARESHPICFTSLPPNRDLRPPLSQAIHTSGRLIIPSHFLPS